MISLLPPSIIVSFILLQHSGFSKLSTLLLFGNSLDASSFSATNVFVDAHMVSSTGIPTIPSVLSSSFFVYNAWAHGGGSHGRYLPMVMHVGFRTMHGRLGCAVYWLYYLNCFPFC